MIRVRVLACSPVPRKQRFVPEPSTPDLGSAFFTAQGITSLGLWVMVLAGGEGSESRVEMERTLHTEHSLVEGESREEEMRCVFSLGMSR